MWCVCVYIYTFIKKKSDAGVTVAKKIEKQKIGLEVN